MSKPKILSAIRELDRRGYYNNSTYLGDAREDPSILDSVIENGIYTFTGGESHPISANGSSKWSLVVRASSDCSMVEQIAERLLFEDKRIIHVRSRKDGVWSDWLDDSINNIAAPENPEDHQVLTFDKRLGTWTNKNADIYLAKVGSTGVESIYEASNTDSTTLRRGVCAVMEDGRTLLLKDVEVNSEGYPVSATFSDGEGYVEASKSFSIYDNSMLIAGSCKTTSLENTPGDYCVTFNFKFTGESTDSSGVDRDEGLYILPLNDSTNPLIPFDHSTDRYYKYKIRLSATSGVQLIFNPQSNGDFSGVIAGSCYNEDVKIKKYGNYVSSSLPANLSRATEYTAKIAKYYDGLYIKVWRSNTTEPANWQCEYHHETIGVASGPNPYEFGFEYHVTNKGNDSEAATISDIKFSAINDWKIMDILSSKDRTTRYFKFTMNENRFVWSNNEVIMTSDLTKGVEARPTITYNGELAGDYNLDIDFSFQGYSAESDPTSSISRDEGLYIAPCTLVGTNGSRYRIRISPDQGVQLIYNTSINGDYGGVLRGWAANNNVKATDYVESSLPQTLTMNTSYRLKLRYKAGIIFIEIWDIDSNKLKGSCSYDTRFNDVHGASYKYKFELWYSNYVTSSSDTEFVKISNMSMQGEAVDIFASTDFWSGMFSSEKNFRNLMDSSGSIWGDYVEYENFDPIISNEKPTTDTVGKVGQLLIVDDKYTYVCLGVMTNGTTNQYVWKKLQSSSIGSLPLKEGVNFKVFSTSDTFKIADYGLEIGDEIVVACIGGGYGGDSGPKTGSQNSSRGGDAGKGGSACTVTGKDSPGGGGSGYGYGCGGGGGGGLPSISGGAGTTGGKGGNGGSCIIKRISLIDSEIPITIGSAGIGGSGNGPSYYEDDYYKGTIEGAGKSGGVTSFGMYLSCNNDEVRNGAIGGRGGYSINGRTSGGGGGGGWWFSSSQLFSTVKYSNGAPGMHLDDGGIGGGGGGPTGTLSNGGSINSSGGDCPESEGQGAGAVFIWY